MYVVESKGGGVALMIAALLLLGTWPALFNLLERKGRVHQDNGASVGFAIAGGVFLVLGNMGTQYALAYTNLSITEVVGSSLTVVGGTILNYFLDDRINRAEILFPGVACFLVAAITGLFVHASNMDDINIKLGRKTGGWLSNIAAKEGSHIAPVHGSLTDAMTTKDNIEDSARGKFDVEKATSAKGSARGSAQFLAEVESGRAIKVVGSGLRVGILILLFNGACYSLFSPSFNLATNDQWHKLPEGVPHLVVYTAFFYFSTSFFGISWLLNLIFLYKPILGAPRSSITEYVMDWRDRHWALLAGVICGLGNGFQFMGGQAAGYAAADSVQALPLVSTIWGVVLFGEYFRSSKRTYCLLAGMLIMFAAAVGLLMGSSGQRKNQ